MEKENKKSTKKLTISFDIKKFMKKSIPMSLALLITLNSTLGVAIIQHYYYKGQINELVSYREKVIADPLAVAKEQDARLQAQVLSEEGIEIPIKWGDLGKRLVEIGVIDEEKFVSLFRSGPISGTDNVYEEILAGEYDGNIVLTQENSRFVLNTLWALGLAQRSQVLDDMKEEYPQVANLAATGGWTIGKANAMEYYGNHDLVDLTSEQQVLVKQITENIYRPCCNNHTAFADCNHGMAMLGLVELMVANGNSEEEIYDVALAVNTTWFPDTYLTIAKYMEKERGLAWEEVDSKEALGAEFSSGSGFRKVLAQVEPVQSSGSGGGCGV
jgi:cytochrome c-type biogenesis protein CcmH/NrfF